MYRTLIDVINSTFRKYPQKTSYSWRDKKEIKSVTYAQTAEVVKNIAIALMDMGIQSGDRVALIADVSYYWILGNLSIQYIGAVDVPRGTDSTAAELAYIINHSESKIVMVQTYDLVEKIEAALKETQGEVHKFIVLQGGIHGMQDLKVVSLEELIEKGQRLIRHDRNCLQDLDNRQRQITRDSIASIIYTSGTTGQPKGVVLTQTNFVSQINVLPGPFELTSADRMLTLLPPWHVFGRILEYIFFEAGATIHYTDIKNLGDDLKRVKPTYVPAVPRVWEGIYNKIMAGVKKGGKESIFNFFKTISLIHYRCMKKFMGQDLRFNPQNIVLDVITRAACFFVIGLLVPVKILGHILVFRKIIAATGGKLRGSISGGGALPAYIDEFFAAVGIKIYEGYGLTETSPVLAVRLPGTLIPGTVGPAVPLTQFKVITAEGIDVTNKPGEKGTLFVKGPQVMKEYYRNPQKTAEVLDSRGWLNTGDLVRITTEGHIRIVGRSKDTIVLRGGENVEPVPVEDKLLESPYIDHAMLVGQDQKSLGALIVPNHDTIKEFFNSQNLPVPNNADWAENDLLNSLISKEIQRLNGSAAGFKPLERVARFRLISKPFEVGDELSNNFKVKRYVVAEKYAGLIKDMYSGEN